MHQEQLVIRRRGMTENKNIFAIIGSASQKSSNLKFVKLFAALAKDEFNLMLAAGL